MMITSVGTSFVKSGEVEVKEDAVLQLNVLLKVPCEQSAMDDVDRRERALYCATGGCFSSAYYNYLYTKLLNKCISG